jgi:hypothetical protein
MHNTNKVNIEPDIYKLPLPTVYYDEFSENKETYTILAPNNDKTLKLLKAIKIHRMNYVYIDILYFSRNDFKKICDFYSIPNDPRFYGKIFVFLEDKKYIGEEFDLYKRMMSY